MPKTIYSEKLLQQIMDNVWKKQALDLSYQKLKAEDIEKLCKALANNTYIKTLNLEDNQIKAQIGDAGAQFLGANKTLTTLGLWGNQIGDAGAQALAANTTLTTLHVSHNKIGAAGAQALAANKTLTTLHVNHNKIGAAGAQALAANTTLTTLLVSHNKIGAVGAQALAANTTLATLYVNCNQIGDVGAQALAANTTLTTLDVSYNFIGDASAQALAANTTLTSLEVGNNNIGHDNVKAIRARVLKNKQCRPNWLRLAPLMAFVRANSTSEIRNSFLPLIPAIATLADEKYQEKTLGRINLDKFFDSRFFKSHVQTQLSAAPAKTPVVTQTADEAKQQGHGAVG